MLNRLASGGIDYVESEKDRYLDRGFVRYREVESKKTKTGINEARVVKRRPRHHCEE